jgi:hypothetical protein
MLSIVFSGALIQVAQIGVTPNGDRLWGCVTQADAFAQRSGADTPARWGFAASASTTDLPCIAPLTSVDVARGQLVAFRHGHADRGRGGRGRSRSMAHPAQRPGPNFGPPGSASRRRPHGIIRAASADRRGEHRRSSGARVRCHRLLVSASVPENNVPTPNAISVDGN